MRVTNIKMILTTLSFFNAKYIHRSLFLVTFVLTVSMLLMLLNAIGRAWQINRINNTNRINNGLIRINGTFTSCY